MNIRTVTKSDRSDSESYWWFGFKPFLCHLECTNDIRMLYSLNDIESYSLYHIDHTISYGPYESYDMILAISRSLHV